MLRGMTNYEARKTALTLAVQVGRLSAREIIDLAEVFESYLTGPANGATSSGLTLVGERGPELAASEPKIYIADVPEPPLGSYIDKDAGDGFYWVHSAEGWRYGDARGHADGEIGTCGWEWARQWAPFTEMKEG